MRRLVLPLLLLVVAACGGGSGLSTPEPSVPTQTPPAESSAATSRAPEPTSQVAGSGCADVIDATVSDDGGTFTVSATISSADTGWEKYADAWQLWDADGNVIGERVLTHPHVDEQPFTRSQSGIVIPDGLTEVTVAARDLVAGFCGELFTLEVPGR
jgi:hypothetical protein